MNTLIGICSQCGGDVTVPTAWCGTLPVPTCQSCGATAKSARKIVETERKGYSDDHGFGGWKDAREDVRLLKG
jgi:hypothetical protein